MFAALFDEVQASSFWKAVGNTLQGWAIGLAIAALIAIPVGIVVGSSQLLYRIARAVIEFLRPIPSVALIPLAILIWGSGLESKVFLAAFAATWPLLMQTLYGVQDVDPVATDTARSFGFGRTSRLLRVTLPSAVPYIATGVRISAAVALILAVTAELRDRLARPRARDQHRAPERGRGHHVRADRRHRAARLGHERGARPRREARPALAPVGPMKRVAIEFTLPVVLLVLWGVALGRAATPTTSRR